MADRYTTLLEWEAPEFRHYPKNLAWYITLILVVILLVVYQAIQGDWFGAISLTIIAIFVGLFARHKPGTMYVEISDKGIHMNDSFIPYTHIKHFWVVHNEDHQVLNFETTAYINHIQSIELVDQDPDEVRDILQAALPEHPEPQETLAQRIAHKFRF